MYKTHPRPYQTVNLSLMKELGDLKPVDGSPKKTVSYLIDLIVEKSANYTVASAIEMGVNDFFGSDQTMVYILSGNEQHLICASEGKTISFQNSIILQTFKTKDVKYLPTPMTDPNYSVAFDPSAESTLYIPIINDSNFSRGVIATTRKNGFSTRDVKKAKSFVHRFKLYYDVLFDNVESHLPQNESLLTIKNFFCCRDIDLYKYENGICSKYNKEKQVFAPVKEVGACEFALKNNLQEVYQNVRDADTFLATVDGDVDEPVLIQTFQTNNNTTTYAIVLRGKTNHTQFSTIDCRKIEAISILLSMQYDVKDKKDADEQDEDDKKGAQKKKNNEDDDETNKYYNRLQALLSVAEVIFGMLDLDELLPTIMEKACSLLKTERCSLFILDKAKNELYTRYQGGLDKTIRIKNGVGIAGYTSSTGKCVNITDAYSDPRFDKTSDKQTGYKTNTLLTVPIYDNRGEIAGVTEMINRLDGQAFDEEDIKMMVAFNVFCGISIDNANLYTTSLDLMNHLRGFVRATNAIGQEDKLSSIIHNLLDAMGGVVAAKYSVAYEYDNETDTFNKIASIGKYPKVMKRVQQAVEERQSQLYTTQDTDTQFGKENTENSATSSSTDATQKLKKMSSTIKINHFMNEEKSSSIKQILAFPLFTNEQTVIGAIELGTDNVILPEDIKLMTCFTVYAALSIEKEKLHQVAEHGQAEASLINHLTEEEKTSTDIPEFFKIDPSKTETLFAINFDAPRWDGIGHFRVLFYLMNSFGLMEQFKISNETFLHFLYEISSSYNKVPYHNWRHAVDVTQFVSYQLRLSGADKILTKLELLSLLIAAICHDANHDGFTNVFNEKAETPLGILFKNQSVMETHHCQVAILITSKEECNIFQNLTNEEFTQAWTTIIALILATDMARHHESLKNANDRMDQGPIDYDNPKDRHMLMELTLKCADISNVSRPFELADKWCDVLCEEFFRQGDLEKTSGMEYTSPLNDRAHLDKPKSQIGFYTFVCLPLFQTAARAMPPLQANVDQINSNLSVWKSRVAPPPPDQV